MEFDYTHLNHNLLMSQKKSGQQGRDYKRGFIVYHTPTLCSVIGAKLTPAYSFLH
jgi:hypothetical protein